MNGHELSIGAHLLGWVLPLTLVVIVVGEAVWRQLRESDS